MKKITFLVSTILLFSSCRKNYSCSCDLVIYTYQQPGGSLPPESHTYSYSSKESINRRVTKKQAQDVCKKTESAVFDILREKYSVTSISGNCVVQ
jgi:hypothetical protein